MEETEQTLEPGLNRAGLLELSDWEFETTLISMLRALMDKVENMQEQMYNISRKIEILKKNQKEMLEEKKHHFNRNQECL